MFDPESALTGRSHRMTLGLRRLPEDEWLIPDDGTVLPAKEQVLREHRDQALFTLPEAKPAVAELRRLIADHLGVPDPSGPDPLADAALMVAEDLCLLTRSDAWRLTAASVCFPSRWDLRAKIGASVAQIHGPVPDYGRISAPVDGFLDRLGPRELWWRTNWTLVDTPDLYQPRPPEARSQRAREWTLRVERQTFRLLPNSAAVVFTIRTFTKPVAQLSQEARSRLAATAATVDDRTAAYRGWPTDPVRALGLDATTRRPDGQPWPSTYA